ncbi:hypothetical protein [Paenisporosarcina quisquiliarum]|uniref:hypothetical protein n=1 Tax=Paenisporosarcina quisquiliarum TaxID=365346 RepID=UPI003734EA7C
MKKVLLFTALIGLGFAGGTIMPTVMADSEDSKNENCNCACGHGETTVMLMPTGSDMLLTTGLIEAISNDSDNSLSKEELVTILTEIQTEQAELNDQTAVMGVSTELPESETTATVNSYREMIQRFITSSKTTTEEVIETEEVTGTNNGLTSILGISTIMNQESSRTTETKKTKNNNGLGNGSEEADGTSSDVKGVDPSNPGKAQTKAKSTTNSNSSVKSTNSTKNNSTSTSTSTKSKEKKEKNNNGLGNGSEPADGTSTDIKGIDPSNPGKGSSKNNAGN